MASYPRRRNVLELPRRHRDLLVLSFAEMGREGWQSRSSFFQLGGIHGWPRATYDKVPHRPMLSGPRRDVAGYCTHGTVFFPTWHRVYMLAFEKALTDVAKRIAATYPANERANYVSAANELRLPYWDWLAANTPEERTPPILWDTQVTINTPTGSRSIDNPMSAYRFAYTQEPNKNPANVEPSVQNGATTFRSEQATVDQDLQDFVPDLVRNREAMMRYNYRPGDWTYISNHSSNKNGSLPQTSYENIHDLIHGVIGQSSQSRPMGHMGGPETAGFDPIFFLHHSNVDRQVAEWQNVHPNVWLPTSAAAPAENEDTEMAPFYRPGSTTQFYTSKDVRWTWRGPDAYVYDNSQAAKNLRVAIDQSFPQ